MHTDKRQAELEKAFDLVANKEHWKLPVNALVPHGTDENLITEAVIHFTGSVPSFKETKKGIRVRAAGYYNTIGA